MIQPGLSETCGYLADNPNIETPRFSERKRGSSDQPGSSPDKPSGFSKTIIFWRKTRYFSNKQGSSGEKLGLSEKNLVYLTLVIFACHNLYCLRNVTKSIARFRTGF